MYLLGLPELLGSKAPGIPAGRCQDLAWSVQCCRRGRLYSPSGFRRPSSQVSTQAVLWPARLTGQRLESRMDLLGQDPLTQSPFSPNTLEGWGGDFEKDMFYCPGVASNRSQVACPRGQVATATLVLSRAMCTAKDSSNIGNRDPKTPCWPCHQILEPEERKSLSI